MNKNAQPEGACMNTIEERLEKIESLLVVLVERPQVREWYTTREFAQAVGKAEFTIREYCRLGRLEAEKRQSGRGAYTQWVISHEELDRYRRNGLLPARKADAAVEPSA
jgi:hypothetical protein